MLWILACAALSWVVLATGAFFYVKYGREYAAVQYRHIFLFPWQANEYRRAKCEFLLAKGKTELLEGKYLEAFNHIRLGLMAVPEDTEARINIVQFYIALKRFDLAEQTLADGVKYNSDKMDYVMMYFRFLFSQQRDDRAIEFSRQLQAQEIKNTDVRHALVMAEASGHYFRGRYTKAEIVLKKVKKVGMSDVSLLLAQIYWQRGQREQALAKLAEVAASNPTDDEVYRARISYLTYLNRVFDARRLSVLRQLEQPDNPRGFVDEISTIDPIADSVRWAGAVSAVFSRFPDNPAAMDGLAGVAASRGQVELAWRVYKQCKAQNIPWLISATAVIEAHLAAKRYADALTATQAILTENAEWAKTNGAQFDAFRSVANFALGDKPLSELQLQNYINDKQANVASFPAVAEQLLRVGAVSQARMVLTAVLKADERNQAALTRLVELDLAQLDTVSLVTNTERLLVMRKPERAFLKQIQDSLQSDRYIFEGSGPLLEKISARLAQKEEG